MAGRPCQPHTFHTFSACRTPRVVNPPDRATLAHSLEELSYGRSLLNRVLPRDPRLTHVVELPSRPALTTEWPSWAAPEVVDALRACGIAEPWSHQTRTAELAASGQHVVVSTGTASGKSL